MKLLVVTMVGLAALGCTGSLAPPTGPSGPTQSPKPSEAMPTTPATPTEPPVAPAATAASNQVLPTSTANLYSLKTAAGTYDLYVGAGVKEAKEKGLAVPEGGWFKLGAVKQAHVDKANGRTEKVTTLSLEDAANDSLDIEVREVTPDGKATNTKFKAGDPCISGVVQVAIDPGSGSPTALFEIIEWVKYPDGPISKNVHATGVVGDSEWPVLKNKARPPADCK